MAASLVALSHVHAQGVEQSVVYLGSHCVQRSYKNLEKFREEKLEKSKCKVRFEPTTYILFHSQAQPLDNSCCHCWQSLFYAVHR